MPIFTCVPRKWCGEQKNWPLVGNVPTCFQPGHLYYICEGSTSLRFSCCYFRWTSSPFYHGHSENNQQLLQRDVRSKSNDTWLKFKTMTTMTLHNYWCFSSLSATAILREIRHLDHVSNYTIDIKYMGDNKWPICHSSSSSLMVKDCPFLMQTISLFVAFTLESPVRRAHAYTPQFTPEQVPPSNTLPTVVWLSMDRDVKPGAKACPSTCTIVISLKLSWQWTFFSRLFINRRSCAGLMTCFCLKNGCSHYWHL